MTSYSNFFEMLDAIEAKMQDPRCKEAGLTPYTGEPLLTSMDLGWIVALPLSERDETFQFSVSLRQIKIDRQDPRWADAYARLQSFTTHFITCPKHTCSLEDPEDNPDYRYYDTFTRDMLWAAWLLSPSRPLYLGVPTRYGYYRVVPRQQFIIRQTTVFRTTNIRVTPPAPRSMTFSSYSSRVTTRSPVQSRPVPVSAGPPSRPAQVSKPTVTRSYSPPSRRR